MLFKDPPVHLASVPCEIYLLKLFGHTWKVKQMVHQQHSDTSAHTHTRTTPSREPGSVGPLCILLSLLCCSLFLPPFSRRRYMYYLYACPSLDTDASCFAILNRSNQQCVKQEWIFYALGVRTSKSPL